MILPIELIQDILDCCEICTQSILICLNKVSYHYLKIKKIKEDKHSVLLTNDILRQNKFNRLEKLSLNFNKKVTELNFLKNTLKELNCRWQSSLSQKSIDKLNLYKLDAGYNYKIKNVSHMNNLKILDCSGDKCGISQRGITGLRLIYLNIYKNKNIINIEFMKKSLKELYCDNDFKVNIHKFDNLKINGSKFYDICQTDSNIFWYNELFRPVDFIDEKILIYIMKKSILNENFKYVFCDDVLSNIAEFLWN